MNRRFSKEGVQISNRYMKRCSMSNLQGNANQNHNEMSPSFVRMTIIKRTRNTKCSKGWGEKGTLVHCWWECKLVQTLWKTVWSFLKKITNRTTIWSSSSTSGYFSKENKNTKSKRYTHPYVHCSTTYNSQDMEANRYPLRRIDEWIKKLWDIYIDDEILN